jgi:hypothetical protein
MSWLDLLLSSVTPGPVGPAGPGAGTFALVSLGAAGYVTKQAETRTVGCAYAVNLVGLIISGASFWWPASMTATTVTVDLWDAVGNNLASVTVTPASGLNTVAFTPFTVTTAYVETELYLSLWNVAHSEVPAINPTSTWPSALVPSLPVMRDARGTRLVSLTQYHATARGWPSTSGATEYYVIDPVYGN